MKTREARKRRHTTWTTRPGHWHTGPICPCGATFCDHCGIRTHSEWETTCTRCGGTATPVTINTGSG